VRGEALQKGGHKKARLALRYIAFGDNKAV
jgi:hypothetical protein